MLWDHRYGASARHGVPIYIPAFAGTHCAYPQRDSQANLTWMAGYIQRWFAHLKVTHPSINWAVCRVTSLIKTNALLLSQWQREKNHRWTWTLGLVSAMSLTNLWCIAQYINLFWLINQLTGITQVRDALMLDWKQKEKSKQTLHFILT